LGAKSKEDASNDQRTGTDAGPRHVGAEVFLAAEEETKDSAVLDLTMDNIDESDINVGEANHDLVRDNMHSLEISDHDLVTLIIINESK
jgi:hypothetical protein